MHERQTDEQIVGVPANESEEGLLKDACIEVVLEDDVMGFGCFERSRHPIQHFKQRWHFFPSERDAFWPREWDEKFAEETEGD